MESYQIGYLIIGFGFLILSIGMFFIGYRYFLDRESSRRIAKDYHWGSFKGFWYRNNSNIFIFLGFFFILIGMGLIIGSFNL